MTTLETEQGQSGTDVFLTKPTNVNVSPSMPRVGDNADGLYALVRAAYLNNPWKVCNITIWRHQHRDGCVTSSCRYDFAIKYYELKQVRRKAGTAGSLAISGPWFGITRLNKTISKDIARAFKLLTGLTLSGLEITLEDQHEKYAEGNILIRESLTERKVFRWRTAGRLRSKARDNKKLRSVMLKSKRSA